MPTRRVLLLRSAAAVTSALPNGTVSNCPVTAMPLMPKTIAAYQGQPYGGE